MFKKLREILNSRSNRMKEAVDKDLRELADPDRKPYGMPKKREQNFNDLLKRFDR